MIAALIPGPPLLEPLRNLQVILLPSLKKEARNKYFYDSLYVMALLFYLSQIMSNQTLSIVIPAYNEGPTIHLILEKVATVQLINGIQKEVIRKERVTIDIHWSSFSFSFSVQMNVWNAREC